MRLFKALKTGSVKMKFLIRLSTSNSSKFWARVPLPKLCSAEAKSMERCMQWRWYPRAKLWWSVRKARVWLLKSWQPGTCTDWDRFKVRKIFSSCWTSTRAPSLLSFIQRSLLLTTCAWCLIYAQEVTCSTLSNATVGSVLSKPKWFSQRWF